MEMIDLYKGDVKRIQHFCKVYSYAKLIAQLENVDENTQLILEAAALTHDIGIHLCGENMEALTENFRSRKDLLLRKYYWQS